MLVCSLLASCDIQLPIAQQSQAKLLAPEPIVVAEFEVPKNSDTTIVNIAGFDSAASALLKKLSSNDTAVISKKKKNTKVKKTITKIEQNDNLLNNITTEIVTEPILDSMPTINNKTVENKIRIITINKITKDTIIEWADPIDSKERTKFINDIVAQKANAPINAKGIQQVDKSELLKKHKAVIINPSAEGTTYFLSNDTLIVNTPADNMANLFTQNADADSTDKLSRKEKRIERRAIRKQSRNDELNTNTEPELKIENETIANATLVGDDLFDDDTSTIVIQDPSLFTSLCKKHITTWTTFKSKAKLHYTSNNNSQNVAANFRLIRDSATWISLNVISIEVARALLTKDSVKAIDKIKNKYYNYQNTSLQQLLQMPIAAADIQQILLGDLPFKNAQPILSKTNKNGIAIRVIANNNTATLVYNTDSTLKSVIVKGVNANGPYTLKSYYAAYENTIYGPLSIQRIIKVLSNNKETKIEIELHKYEFDTPLELPYSVPSSFKNGLQQQ